MNTSEQHAFMNRGQKTTSHLDIDGENPFPISENFWVLDALRSLDGDVGSVDGANDSGDAVSLADLPREGELVLHFDELVSRGELDELRRVFRQHDGHYGDSTGDCRLRKPQQICGHQLP